MRDVPASIAATWRDGAYIGERRPIARVTIQHPTMKLRNYSLTSAFREVTHTTGPKDTNPTVTIDTHHGRKVHQTYADFLFTTMGRPMELPNVKSVTWTRSIDTDVADCTIECWNTAPLPIGVTPRAGELDYPGYYTYSRGGSAFSTRWMHNRNEWFGMVVPDNIMRTYEGYGWDDSVSPEVDPNLVLTGVWIIDTVTMTASGTLSIKARDIGRILMDQMFYPPVVPKQFYDLGFQNWSGIYERDPAVSRVAVKATDSSNTPWIGSGSVQGHKLSYAFDGDPNTYWLSIGNIAPSRRFAYEWVQCSVGNQTVSQVRLRTKKKGYVAYISVKVGGVWQGANSINYHEDGIGMNGGDIAYVATKSIDTESTVTINFPAVKKAQAVRVTLGNLQNFHIPTYDYRAGIRDVAVYNATTSKHAGVKGPAGANPGRYDDYTDLVKLFCAWGGLFWPAGARQRRGDIHVAANAVDANPATYWESYTADYATFTIDLGANRTTQQMVISLPASFSTRVQTIAVEGSIGGTTFTTFIPSHQYSFTSGQSVQIPFGGASFRYLRLRIEGNSVVDGAQLGSVQVYADTNTPPTTPDLAYGKPVYASSTLPVYVDVSPAKYDWKVLGKGVKGRVWGDFMQTGTNGAVALAATEFDKKSLMECIGVIRDILGFIFFIDETGGAIWRFPNIQNRGCWKSTISAHPGYQHNFAHQIDENTILMSLDCTIDSKNVRESIAVGDGLGKIGAFAPGFNPNPTGLRRIAAWTDTNFGSASSTKKGKDAIDDAVKQCQLMADLISLRQLFTYRTDRLRIPANPAIQVDDQVRIFERTTAEGYLHYVKGISSNLDASTGEWTYDLDTHWLGFDPKSRWIYKPEQLLETTQGYIQATIDEIPFQDTTSRTGVTS